MSQKEIKKRKVWQDKVYKSLKEVKKVRIVSVLGKKLTVLPGMFAPLWGDSISLAKVIQKEVKKTDSVLDLGTGSGVQGIFAGQKAKSVISVDINPLAVKCATLNVYSHKLDKKIKVFKSNLFSNLENKKFSLILFNPPFRWFKPRSMLERGEVDANYKTLRKFFKDVKSHLTKNGRVLLVFSTSGDVKYLELLMKESGFKFRVLMNKRLNGWNYPVYRISI